jgi:hypothetical protein
VQVIPTSVKITLSLGYKFSFSSSPNFSEMKKFIYEGMRKVAWKIFFNLQGNKDSFNETEMLFHKIKKTVCPSALRCPLENVLFGNNFTTRCNKVIKQKCCDESALHKFLKNDLVDFMAKNNIIIKPSDKNAGLCIMNYEDYSIEVKRQLNDTNTYRPATLAEFDFKMFECKDKSNHVSNWLFKNKKMRTIIPTKYKPAKFYLLPKMHKPFSKFPSGRPISSTVNVINRGISMMLDKILQPLSHHINNLILDSPQLLLLLQNLKLDPERKYILITADINSMYLELPISVCKNNCLAFFDKYKHVTQFPIEMNKEKVKQLLDLSLDYSYLEYDNEIFYQTKGIQMGNCASVSIANITAGVELEDIWGNEIIFNGRFIDDLIAIADVTSVTENYSTFIENMLKHKFLKFTYEFSEESVNFLDMTISLNNDNSISTTLFQKPMNKHEFVHYQSNHPRHLLKSLPYSCGLRIKRTCSDTKIQETELEKLMLKFKNRGYPLPILDSTMHKLQQIDRNELLKPKSTLLINFLRLHNPGLLNEVKSVQKVERKQITNNKVYITIPFTNRVNHLSKYITDYFIKSLNQCQSASLKKCIVDLNIKVAYSVPNALRRYIDKK